MQDDLITYLESFLTKERISLLNKLIDYRTKYITVVLEDIYQSHNASAVLRTCDCFGIQDVHIVENRNQYTVNPDVALGANKWLNLVKYNTKSENSLNAIRSLKKSGYRIIATSPIKGSKLLEDFNICKGKFALCFGTELKGLSDVFLNHADECIKIPMYGFTESYNISVSAAIILYHLSESLRKSDISWQLSSKEKHDVMLQWYRVSVKKSDILIKDFYARKQ